MTLFKAWQKEWIIYKYSLMEQGVDSMEIETKTWYLKNIRILRNILDVFSMKTDFITPRYILKHVKYEKSNHGKSRVVGRLYNFMSMQLLPKEIRYYIFNDQYRDFDMVNAHPSILYSFALKKGLALNGTLKEFINNRDEVVQLIFNELNNPKGHIFLISNNISVFEKKEIENLIIKILDRTQEKNHVSNTLKNLDEDFTMVREHIWSMYSKGLLPQFEAPLEKKKRTKPFFNAKISLQSFFCHDRESYDIKKLIEYLQEKYCVHMKKKELSKLTDVYTYTNPTVELDSIHTLSLVPFFDGLFVYSPDDMFDYTISDLIKEFNMSHEDKHIIVFVKKTMTQNEDYITNIKEYVQIKIILS